MVQLVIFKLRDSLEQVLQHVVPNALNVNFLMHMKFAYLHCFSNFCDQLFLYICIPASA